MLNVLRSSKERSRMYRPVRHSFSDDGKHAKIQHFSMKNFCKLIILASFNTVLIHYASAVAQGYGGPVAKPLRMNDVFMKISKFILVGDIGGTTTRFGIIESLKDSFKLHDTINFKSQEIDNFASIITKALERFKKKKLIPYKACFAIAGVVSDNKKQGTLSNSPFDVDAKTIKKETSLEEIFVINDFEAIGYGLDVAPSSFFKTLKKNKKPIPNAPKGIIGAGTGLGKSIVLWDKRLNQYIPRPSEGGHGDCALQSSRDTALASFIRTQKNKTENTPISWEDILSGKGLKNIYLWTRGQNIYESTDESNLIEQNNYSPDFIVKYIDDDPTCRYTWDIFLTMYARCAKNFALDLLARGGIYIAGGIAINNYNLFKSSVFINEFENNEKLKDLLASIPLYIITSSSIALYGAAAYATNPK